MISLLAFKIVYNKTSIFISIAVEFVAFLIVFLSTILVFLYGHPCKDNIHMFIVWTVISDLVKQKSKSHVIKCLDPSKKGKRSTHNESDRGKKCNHFFGTELILHKTNHLGHYPWNLFRSQIPKSAIIDGVEWSRSTR